MGGNEGAHGKMGGGGGGQSESVARLDSHVLLSCIFPPNSVIPHFRTDHCSKEPKTMKQENTHPILKF